MEPESTLIEPASVPAEPEEIPLSNSTSIWLQYVAVIAFFITFIVEGVATLSVIGGQAITYKIISAINFIVPIIVFLIIYNLNPRNISSLTRFFEAIVATVAIRCFYNLIPILYVYVPSVPGYPSISIYLQYALPVVVSFICIIFLIWLRKANRWK